MTDRVQSIIDSVVVRHTFKTVDDIREAMSELAELLIAYCNQTI